jgi:hypothetical protein
MKTTVEEVKAILREAGLENAGTGVVFPWGAKIVEFEGKKALRPMSPDEYRETVRKETGKTLSDEEIRWPTCIYANYCISQGCTEAGHSCHIHVGEGANIFCLCE